VQWHPSTSNQARQTTPSETSASFGSGSFGGWTATDTAITLSQRDHKGSMTMVVGSLAARDYKGVGNQYVDEGKVIVEPFTKSKRPQTATDDETWVANQPNPTLNAFDQGDTRATTVIVQEPMVFQPGSMVRLGTKPSDGIVPTLRAEVKGGDNEPVIAYETQDPVLLTMREGKPGGGKGPLLSTDKSLSLSTSNEQLLFTPTDNPIVFENSYRDAARIAEDGITQTLTSKMGTGGGNTPMVAIPIQDGRDMDHQQNGLGVADEGSPSYTIDQTGAQAIAYGLQGNMIGRQDHNGPQGAGISHPDDPMFSLTSTDRHAVAHVAAGFKVGQGAGARSVGYEEEMSSTLPSDAGGNKAGVLTPTMAVRRLTPLECERLMGWPDGWTATKADGTPQSDTHRYKQCGNGIASPVAQWIAQQLLTL
jgi:hypothetical protein